MAAPTKPASRVIAKSIPAPNGLFYAQFALPGLVPDLVRNQRGSPWEYDNEISAADAACRTLVAVLKARTTDTRKAGGYIRMTPAEFGKALADAEITPTYFAELYGVPYHRVMKWLDGEQDIPHSVRLLVALIVEDANFDMAKKITELALEKP